MTKGIARCELQPPPASNTAKGIAKCARPPERKQRRAAKAAEAKLQETGSLVAAVFNKNGKNGKKGKRATLHVSGLLRRDDFLKHALLEHETSEVYIMSLATEHNQPAPGLYCKLKDCDIEHLDMQNVKKAVRLCRKALEEGKQVYCHCREGENRAILIACMVIWQELDKKVLMSQIIEDVRMAKHAVSPHWTTLSNVHFENFLLAYGGQVLNPAAVGELTDESRQSMRLTCLMTPSLQDVTLISAFTCREMFPLYWERLQCHFNAGSPSEEECIKFRSSFVDLRDVVCWIENCTWSPSSADLNQA